VHEKLIKKDLKVSSNYSCHAWIDNRLIICSNSGEIFIAETTGDFKMLLASSPSP